MTCLVCGIDPGLRGMAAALFDDCGPAVTPLPLDTGNNETDFSALTRLLEILNPGIVIIEKPTGTPSPGSAMKLGQSLGTTICAALSARFRVVRVHPREWQSAMLSKGEPDTKTASIKAARALYPDFALNVRARSRIADHNVSDALLIAEYGRRKYCK